MYIEKLYSDMLRLLDWSSAWDSSVFAEDFFDSFPYSFYNRFKFDEMMYYTKDNPLLTLQERENLANFTQNNMYQLAQQLIEAYLVLIPTQEKN